mmetsp:Transcript_16190/g.45727  ORF Transcript_16190/g.45727 Transcript_16190/m.45727 type:complete len:150 (+) Transcript_16190:1-450(+)
MKRRERREPSITCLDILGSSLLPFIGGISLDCSVCTKMQVSAAVYAWYVLDTYGLHDHRTADEENAFLVKGSDGKATSFLAFIWSCNDCVSDSMLVSRSLAIEPAKRMARGVSSMSGGQQPRATGEAAKGARRDGEGGAKTNARSSGQK